MDVGLARGAATRWLALAVAVPLVVGAAWLGSGCGDDAGQAQRLDTDRQELDRLMSDYRHAFEAGNGDAGCALVSRSLDAELAALDQDPPLTCSGGFEFMTKQNVVEDMTPKILSVRVDGDRASIVGWPSHDKERQTAHFVKEDGQWKLVTWFAS